MVEIKTTEITWDDIRMHDYITVEQIVPAEGPRREYRVFWAGEVVEHSMKWTRVKYDGKVSSVPVKWGDETILRIPRKDFKKYLKQLGVD